MKKLVSDHPFNSAEQANRFVLALDDEFPKSGAEIFANGYSKFLFVRISEKHLAFAQIFLRGYLAGDNDRSNAILVALQA